VHKIFTVLTSTFYLQYHLDYKKPATKLPAIFKSFLFTEVLDALTFSQVPSGMANNPGLTVPGKPHHALCTSSHLDLVFISLVSQPNICNIYTIHAGLLDHAGDAISFVVRLLV